MSRVARKCWRCQNMVAITGLGLTRQHKCTHGEFCERGLRDDIRCPICRDERSRQRAAARGSARPA